MIPANLTPEEKRIAWENLKAFMDLTRRLKTSNNSGAADKSAAAPIFSEARYE